MANANKKARGAAAEAAAATLAALVAVSLSDIELRRLQQLRRIQWHLRAAVSASAAATGTARCVETEAVAPKVITAGVAADKVATAVATTDEVAVEAS